RDGSPRAARDPGAGARTREIADATDETDPVGRGDGSAGVEDVELMGAGERRLVRRDDETLLERALRLGFPAVEKERGEVGVGDLEVIAGELLFFELPDLPVSDRLAPRDVVDRVHLVQKHGDALESVGDLG